MRLAAAATGLGLLCSMLAHLGICRSAAAWLNLRLQCGQGMRSDVSMGGGGGRSDNLPPLARCA